MNVTTLITSLLGLLILGLALTKPRMALLVFVFSLMAFNDYLGGHPSSIVELGGNRFYGADFFVIPLAVGVLHYALQRKLSGSRVDEFVLALMVVSTIASLAAILIGLGNGHKANDVVGDFRRYMYYPWALFIPPLLLGDRKGIRLLEGTIFAAAGVICTIASYRIVTWTSYWPEQHETGYGDFRAMSYHDYLILILAVCLAIGKVLDGRKRPTVLHRVSLVGLPIFVIASNYRMAPILMVLASALVVLMLARRRRDSRPVNLKPLGRSVLLSVSFIAVVCIAGAVTENKTYMDIQSRLVDRVVQFDWSEQESYRAEMWKRLLAEWQTSPSVGVGFGRKFEYLNRTQNGTWYWVAAQNFHNSYLELLLKSGILGLAIFLCLQTTILTRSWRSLTSCPDDAPFAAAGIAFMIAALIQTGLQPLLTEPNSIVVIYLVIGSVVGLPLLSAHAPERRVSFAPTIQHDLRAEAIGQTSLR